MSKADVTTVTGQDALDRFIPPPPAITREQFEAFITAYQATGIVAEAAAAAGVCRMTVYRWRQRDPSFAAAWDEAKAQAERHRLDAIEEHAQRVAAEGWERPVYQGGTVVGSYAQPEPRLMMYMLERRRAVQYGARSELDVNVTQTARVELSDEDRALLEPLKRKLLLGESAGPILDAEVIETGD